MSGNAVKVSLLIHCNRKSLTILAMRKELLMLMQQHFV